MGPHLRAKSRNEGDMGKSLANSKFEVCVENQLLIRYHYITSQFSFLILIITYKIR